MLIKLVVDLPGSELPIEEYITLSEASDNILNTSDRKLNALARKWRKATENMCDEDKIIEAFYDLLDDAEIDYGRGGPDKVIRW